jgi:hypothetical protein
MTKHQSKKEQKEMDKYLSERFAEISRGQELIPVVLDRATWEGVVYSINLALKLERNMTKKVKVVEPAIVEKSGKVVKGKPSQSHEEIIKKAGKGAKGAKHEFVLTTGEIADRKKAAKVAKSAGEVKNPGEKLHSHELREGLKVKKAKEPK